MNILMVLTSHDRLGNTGHKTGFWLEEFAAPYYVFKDARATLTLASPRGGQPPLDPKSDDPVTALGRHGERAERPTHRGLQVGSGTSGAMHDPEVAPVARTEDLNP